MTELIIVVLDLVLFGGLVLVLHRASTRYGLAPLLFYLAGSVAVLHSMAAVGVYVRPVGDLTLVIGSNVVVPVVWLGLLVIYIVDGTAAARLAMLGIIGVSALAFGIQAVQSLHLQMPGSGSLLDQTQNLTGTLRITVASTVAFAAALTAITIVYQGLRNYVARLPIWAVVGVALLSSGVTDAVVFGMVLHGVPGFLANLPMVIAGKSISAVILWPMAGYYLTRVARDRPHFSGVDSRRTFDLLLGAYGRQADILMRTEAALRESEARLRTVVANSPIIVFALDRDGVFTLSEGRGLEALGLKRGEVVGKSVFDLFPMVSEQIHRCLAGEAFGAVVEVGNSFFETVYTPSRSAAGDIVGVTGVSTDISEIMRTERALRESEERLRSTFEQAAVGIAHVSPHGEWLWANKKICEILGYTDDELRGMQFQDLLHPDDLERNVEFERRLATDEIGVYSTENRYIRKDGAVVWAHLTVSPVRTETGVVEYLISVLQDISDRRATEDQLRQAQKMEAVGQLTGGVAHDFNNLLTVIMGGLELALEKMGHDPEARSALEPALEATHRSASLTQRLLAFSRKQALRPTIIDFRELLFGMRTLLVRTLGEMVTIDLHVTPDLWKCEADRSQLENVVLNLAVNARDAMRSGGRLTLTAANAELNEADRESPDDLVAGQYVVLAVSDTGTGMSSGVVERVFEPFYTTKEIGEGSGLGLSMIYGFVRQSGGDVKIESEVGVGTTVRIYLPRVEASVSKDVPTAPPTEHLGHGETVLVVEDDPDVRRGVVRQLVGLGYQPIEAEDGPSALQMLDARTDVTLLLTDIVLPGGMSGVQLAEEAASRLPKLKVLYSSGYTREAITRHGRLDEGVELLEKPYMRAELANSVAKVLKAGV